MALRDPDKTRTNILNVAAANFHQKGFKGTSLSDILQQAEISKGALYHHFTNKQELLYAVFDELYSGLFLSRWTHILTAEDPIEAIAQTVEHISHEGSDEEMCQGCPVHNLAAEMASSDEGVRTRVDNLYCEIQRIIKQGVDLSKQQNLVPAEANSQRIALFFMCCFNGMPQMVKSCQDREVFVQLTSALAEYVRGLKS
ncbi:MAG: TetR/AcrR family transcriptional regulator [Gammaproteobacteria bacterium]|nr:TetR/AcrR family transcriptional regulator [Gammaproteobacteria bacterium]